MVSIRRRRLLGLCTGVQDKNEKPHEDAPQSSNSVHRLPLYDLNITAEDGNDDPSMEIGSSKVSAYSHSHDQPNTSYDQPNQPNTSGLTLWNELDDNQPMIEIEVKGRKQHRRRRFNNVDGMRGVYYKNNKYQAAIKVDTKQIHLGTVRSQAEAAHLYDRAAFMCGRAPNYELSEEEKQELEKLTWDEFLAITRSAITCKRSRRGRVIGKVQPSLQNSD